MSLGAKLTLWLLIPVLALLSILALVTLRREEEVHYRRIAGEAERLANTLAIVATEALRHQETAEVAAFVRRSGLDAVRFGLAVYDGAGRPVFTWGLSSTAQGLGPQEIASLLTPSQGTGKAEELEGIPVQTHLVALAAEGRLLGGLKVAASLREVHAVLARERNAFLGTLAAVGLLLTLLISLTVHHAVSQPLARLMERITTLARGQAPEDVTISGEDEVAQLAREFNALARNLDEARRRLTQESEHARNVIQSITDGIIGVDPQGKIRTWNRAMVERYGIPESEVLGRGLFEAFPALEREGLRPEMESLLRGEAREFTLRRFEHETLRRGRVVLNIRGNALRGAIDVIAGAVLAIEDVTDRVSLVQEVQQAEKLAVVGQLAAGIAHQIGTPLNVISGSAEYLMMEWGADKPRPQELEIIVAQTERITKLIRQLMNFARPARIDLRPLNLNDLLQEVLTLTEHQIAKEKIDVRSDFQANLPPIMGDANQLEQAFLNIIINAWHAMPGGGTMTLTTRLLPGSDRQRRPGRAGGPGIETSIADTGTGIAPDHMGRIFDPFFSTKGVGKGTGLGLAISRRIVEDHHGSIEVESGPGKGTTFTIWLPLGEQTA